MGLLRAIFGMDRIVVEGVWSMRCPRAVWVIAFIGAFLKGCEIILKAMSWLLAWIQG